MREFIQIGPGFSNQFAADALLQQYLAFRLPREVYDEIEPDLQRFGAFVAGACWDLENSAEANPPVHIPFSAWGERIDEIRVSRAWEELHAVAAREGIIAIGYERKQAEFSRLYQFAKLYLFHPSSAFYSCPLAMTDGAAKLLEIYGDADLRAGAFQHLTSRQPKTFWTSGQWMTERSGGSDVGRTETVAKADGDDYRLFGTKWFSSATTSDMAMALARIEGDPEGSRGLSVFYLEMREPGGRLNGISIHRLKDKLGTKALPTAELKLEGARARLIGKRGHGVATIASLFNITRIYNAVCALGGMRRALVIAKDYAEKRLAFGKKISEQPLHLETLAGLELDFHGCFHLTFHLARLLGLEEQGGASEGDRALLRMLTPIAKLFTGKKAVELTSEAIECIGGAAYVEDTYLPRLLRNAQVFPIWEGTTNILSLDVLRAIEKESAFPAFTADVEKRLSSVRAAKLGGAKSAAGAALGALANYLREAHGKSPEIIQAGAREFALAAAKIYTAALLLEFADWSLEKNIPNQSAEVAIRWCSRGFSLPHLRSEEQVRNSSALLFPGR